MRPKVKLMYAYVEPLVEAIKTYRGIGVKRAKDLFDLLWRRGHDNPYEFGIFVFKIENISSVAAQHLTRHRTGKFASSSHRYKQEYWKKEKLEDIFIYTMDFKHLLPDEMQDKVFNAYIQVETTEELTNDELSYCEPRATRYLMLTLFDLRNLFNLLKQRLNPAAHFEIRSIAKQIYQQIKSLDGIKEIDLPVWIAMEWKKLKMAKENEDKLREEFFKVLGGIE